jgi:hypothetical protein
MDRSRAGLRVFVAFVAWIVCASLVQEALGDDVGQAARPLQERLELRVRERSNPPPWRQQRERSHEESIEPWELVSV